MYRLCDDVGTRGRTSHSRSMVHKYFKTHGRGRKWSHLEKYKLREGACGRRGVGPLGYDIDDPSGSRKAHLTRSSAQAIKSVKGRYKGLHVPHNWYGGGDRHWLTEYALKITGGAPSNNYSFTNDSGQKGGSGYRLFALKRAILRQKIAKTLGAPTS